MVYDVIVVGCGPAGMSAAIYAKRSNLNVLVIEKETPGGKLLNIGKIDNYLGFNNVSGTDLAVSMYDHFNSYNIPLELHCVANIEQKEGFFEVTTTENRYEARSVIVTSGLISSDKTLPGEKEFVGKGVSYCAMCDGFLYKDKEVALIGDQNSINDINYLLNIVKKLYLIGNVNINNEKLVKISKFNSLKIEGNEKVEQICIDDSKILVDAVFIEGNSRGSLINIRGIMMKNNCIVVNDNMETNIKGLYAAGDCIFKTLKQVATAVAEGSIAATSAFRYLKRTD